MWNEMGLNETLKEMPGMKKYPISVEARIADFEKQTKTPIDDEEKAFLTMMTKLENQAYEQGRADALLSTWPE